MINTDLLEHWYDALRSSVGIILVVDDPKRAIQSLYRARATSQDDSLAALSIRTSPQAADEIWIVKNG